MRLTDEEMKQIISDNIGLLDDVTKAPELLFKVADAQLAKCQLSDDELVEAWDALSKWLTSENTCPLGEEQPCPYEPLHLSCDDCHKERILSLVKEYLLPLHNAAVAKAVEDARQQAFKEVGEWLKKPSNFPFGGISSSDMDMLSKGKLND
jgi:hypothetical protein